MCIEISDSGVGMPADVLSRVFERGFTTKPPHEGQGLGLSICRELLGGQEGDIRISSRPGRGNRVIVTLQAASAAIGSAPDATGGE